LLAYLATSGREHHRDRLSTLLWDVTDDPRGALRWSLSKLRGIVNDEVERIAADREHVSFVAAGARIDVLDLWATTARGIGGSSTEDLARLAALARGEFMEGFELPDFLEFQGWCMANRERAREARCQVLAALVGRLRDKPQQALPHARARVLADSFSVEARVEFLELLLHAGMAHEARQQMDIACRLFREVDAPGVAQLENAWRGLSTAAKRGESVPQRVEVATHPAPLPDGAPPEAPFIGRRDERGRLETLFDESCRSGGQRIALVTGEPGAGKSRLVDLIVARARGAGATVMEGRAFEAEGMRPYGPLVDALDVDVAQLIPESDARAPVTRDTLFAALAEALTTSTQRGRGAMLVLDDIQWLDRDSAELLHFLVRINQQRPLFIVLLARSGELNDNEPASRALRGMRREAQLEEIDLAPLSRDEIDELVSRYEGANADRIHEASAGNPLYALELARASADGAADAPRTLVELIRERIDRLPAHAAELLRWGAVLGHTVDVARLKALSSLEFGALIDALARLEQHALLRIEDPRAQKRYVFAHDIVREAVYGELSHPRRRLMHQQVAKLLEPESTDSAVATEVAYHASLAGDALLGVRACIVAGLRSLRVFANGDAETLARRGLRLVDELPGSDRVASTLDLLHIQYSARAPAREQAAARVRTLAEQALDLGLTRAARPGFQMLSFLRWESSSMVDAHDNIMQAERLSRSGDPKERSVTLGQAAKCLVLLERNMRQAEAFVLEVDMLSDRGGRSTSAAAFAVGMIHRHRGELEEAARCFQQARQLGREQGDRLAEFCAVEHATMLEIDRGHHAEALDLATHLADLGQRVRPGAEAPSGRALLALAQRACGQNGTDEPLDAAIQELRAIDAKYQLSFIMTRLARLDLERGDVVAASARANEALQFAESIGRASEVALSHVLLAQCAERSAGRAAATDHLDALRQLAKAEISSGARRQAEAVLADSPA